MFAQQQSAETAALQSLKTSTTVSGAYSKDALSAAATILGEFHESNAVSVRDAWWEFFFRMTGTYRDMYKIVNAHTETFTSGSYKYLGAPK